MKKASLIFLLILFLSSCANLHPRYGRETYYVESNGAFLPVIIEGPHTDKVIFVFHGGPGSTAMLLYYQPLFQRLLKRYRMVFWDQRCSGGSRGYADDKTISIGQEVEDAKVVLDSVRALYPRSKFYVFGISFGGMIGSAFISKYSRDVEASMFMSPAMSLANMRRMVPKHSLTFINSLLSNPDISMDTRSYWEKAQTFYQSRPLLGSADFEDHEKYSMAMDAVNGIELYYPYLKQNIGSFLSDPICRVFNLKKQALRFIKALEDNNLSEFDLTTDPEYNVSKVSHSIMMQVGDMDYLVPLADSQRGYNAFNNGTPAPGSEFIIHQKVSHYLGIQLPNVAYDNYVRFVDAH